MHFKQRNVLSSVWCFALAFILFGLSINFVHAQSAAREGAADLPHSVIVYRQSDEKGRSDQLIVLDPHGKKMRQIKLPELVDCQDLQYNALLLCTNLQDELVLVNTSTGTTHPITLAGDEPVALELNAPQVYNSGGTRWRLLGDNLLTTIALLDLQTGDLLDLRSVGVEIEQIYAGQISPDEKHVLMTTSDALWLIPIADPSKARQLAQEQKPWQRGFTDDGQHFIYTRRGATDQHEVVLESLDGSISEVIVSSLSPLIVTLTQDRKLLVTSDIPTPQAKPQPIHLRTYRLTHTPPVVQLDSELEASFQPNRLIAAPNERWLLLADETNDKKPVRRLIDLRTGESRDFGIPYLLSQNYIDRWVWGLDNVRPTGSHTYFSFDRETGTVKKVLETGEVLNPTALVLAPNGAQALLTAYPDFKKMQLWLLDAKGRPATMISAATNVSGAFSLDGRQIVLGVTQRSARSLASQIQLFDLASQQMTVLAEDGNRAWWLATEPPTPASTADPARLPRTYYESLALDTPAAAVQTFVAAFQREDFDTVFLVLAPQAQRAWQTYLSNFRFEHLFNASEMAEIQTIVDADYYDPATAEHVNDASYLFDAMMYAAAQRDWLLIDLRGAVTLGKTRAATVEADPPIMEVTAEVAGIDGEVIFRTVQSTSGRWRVLQVITPGGDEAVLPWSVVAKPK